MAVRVLRAAVLLALALCLGSCNVLQFIFGSVFPSTTTLLQSRADLSAKIASGGGGSYNLHVLESQGFGYVVLDSGTIGAPIYIFDLSLNLKKVLTGLASSGAIVDGFTGDIVIGDVAMNPADLSAAATQPPAGFGTGSQGSAGSDGFFTGPGGFNVSNLYIGSGASTLSFSIFTAAWAGTPVSPGPALSAVQSLMTLSATLDDGNTADDIILAVTLLNGAQLPSTYFLQMPRSDFTAAPGGAGVLDTSPHRDGLLSNTIGYSGGELVAWDTATQSFVRMDPVTLKTMASFYAPADKNSMAKLRYAYRAGGGGFYAYDPDGRVITGYSTWW
jgi:hypothetical protein